MMKAQVIFFMYLIVYFFLHRQSLRYLGIWVQPVVAGETNEVDNFIVVRLRGINILENERKGEEIVSNHSKVILRLVGIAH